MKGGPHNVKTHTGFINPDGEAVTITNLFEFCLDNDLNPEPMYRLKSGKHSQYRGWTYRKEEL